MPMIMDDDHYMDDLFGDSEPVHVQPPAPPIKGLSERLDELQQSACCQKLAWANTGCVASITPNGQGVNLRVFQRSPKDGRWALSDESPLEMPQLQDELQLVHVSWSHLGYDLAVVDSSGRVTIFTFSFSGVLLGKMNMTRTAVMDAEDEMGALVGLHWLPTFPHLQKTAIAWSATRNGDDWAYRLTHPHLPGPHNPADGKCSMVCLTRHGTIRLLYQRGDNRWLDTSAELESISSAVPVAPVSPDSPPDEKTYPTIIAVYTHSPHLPNTLNHQHPLQDAYSIVVRWELHFSTPTTLHYSFDHISSKTKPASSVPARQSLSIKPLEDVLSHSVILNLIPETISHLRFVVSHSDGSLEFRSRDLAERIGPDYNFDHVSSLAQAGFAFPNLDGAAALHVAVSPSSCVAAPLAPDGSVSTKPIGYTLAPLNGRGDANGNGHGDTGVGGDPADDPKLAAAMVALALQHYSALTTYRTADDVLMVLAGGGSGGSSGPATAAVHPTLKRLFTTQVYQAFGFSLDYVTPEQQKQVAQLLRMPLLYKSLSTQFVLGSSGAPRVGGSGGGRHTLQAKAAWIVLNLRSVTVNISIGFNKPENIRADLVHSLAGLASWSLDVMVYVVAELYYLSRAVRGNEDNRDLVQAKMRELNSPALICLLASVPRSLFRLLIRPLGAGLNISRRAVQNPASSDPSKAQQQQQPPPHHYPVAQSLAQRQQYLTLSNVYESSPLPLRAFEALATEVDAQVRERYVRAGVGDAERARAERGMLVGGELPEVLMPVVRWLLGPGLQRVKDEVDLAALLVYPVRWLGLYEEGEDEDGDRSGPRRRARNAARGGEEDVVDAEGRARTRVVDVLRKVSVPPGTRLRRCTRCCSFMEDVRQEHGQPLQNWAWQAQRTCICFNMWAQA
ncbi:mediator complex subunit 16-domain-containing protein [Lineolata rhizophorae]|uniref:Mediator of RNA polymerase II transcription subunit 16 n=1 Tax=Lineolata rhizophorae TaxID=578093 RepID=A0A6A6PA99_9PEZI|nr:mediator complex subunit 16-domain-containing protein [Lineolata rhizophorae]